MFPFVGGQDGFTYTTAIAANLAIYVVLLITVPSLLIVFISLIKPKIKEKSNFYLYAFSSAMFIMIGTVGLIKEGFEKAENYTHNNGYSEINEQLMSAILIGCGAILGLSFAIAFRYFFVKRTGEVHKSHDLHSHDDHIINLADIDNPKAAWLVIFLLLSHRTIDGLVLGSSVAEISSHDAHINWGLIITFNFHILIEALIVYYRQVQFGQKKWKAVLYNFYTLLALIPIMIIGAATHNFLEGVGWILPIVNASGGSIITFVGVIELVPEFLHHNKMNSKEWYKLIFWFALGIVFALIILSFHSHDEEHSHSEELLTSHTITNLKLNLFRYQNLNYIRT